jgi:hypothetical protein
MPSCHASAQLEAVQSGSEAAARWPLHQTSSPREHSAAGRAGGVLSHPHMEMESNL